FERSYEQNCLVNAMCLGIAPHARLTRAAAAGPGNVIVLLGALTGRDGIGGASVLASAELGEGDEAKRPSVQIGDPFTEKKLLECCLELLDRELLTSLQDLGAAGLTSSASEMASKGDVGIDIDVSRIPLREPDMEPFEIMVSESQERMLCVARPECVGELLAVCEHWEVLATTIGCVTEGDSLSVLHRGTSVAEMPVSVLVDDCPLYDLDPSPPDADLYGAPPAVLGGDEPPGEVLLALLRSPNLACVGAEPLGLTNCLNFGNPEKPHVAWQLVEAVEGLSEACESLGIPVVGGNVSLYNEAPSGPIFPTPVVGMVGKLPHAAAAG